MTPEIAAAILNVSTSASREEIEKAFKLRARMSHPDRFAGSPVADIRAATAEFVRITEARDALRLRLPGPTPASPNQPPRRAPQPQPQAQPQPQPQAQPQPLAQPQPMSFEDFVRARDARSWSNPRTSPPPPAGTAKTQRPGQASSGSTQTPGRLRRERFVLPIIVLVLIAIAWALTATSRQANDEEDTVSSNTGRIDIYENVSQEFLDDDQDAQDRLCTDVSYSCWIWELTASTSCEAAEVKVDFSDTSDGETVQSSTQVVSLESGVPTTLIEEATNRPGYAGIASILC